MKRFIVEQNGCVQVYASRSFIVEVPDEIDEEGVYERVTKGSPVAEGEDMAWCDELDRRWIGFDVDVIENDVSEMDSDTEPSQMGLKVITFNDLADNGEEG